MIEGATMVEMMASIVLIQMVVHVIQTCLVMTVMYIVFDNPLEGSLTALSWLMVFTGVAGMFFGTFEWWEMISLHLKIFHSIWFPILGFMLAVINTDMKITAYSGIGVNIVLCFTSGKNWKSLRNA